MGVPEHIRKVERPKNTVVVDYGNGTYAVRERNGCRVLHSEDGTLRRVPVDGKIIGHIANGRFIPKNDKPRLTSVGRVDVKDWANVHKCDELNQGELYRRSEDPDDDAPEGLVRYFETSDATWMYCEAVLRCCYPGVRDYQLSTKYRESFLSEMYPNTPFGSEVVGDKTEALGEQSSLFYAYMQHRIDSLDPDDEIIIDGCLRTDDCRDASISAVSRKTAATKRRHHLVLYAYSRKRMEPVCMKTYPGNMTDARALADFLRTFRFRSGTVICDRGFPPVAMEEAISLNTELHYLVPLESDLKIIDDYHMLDLHSSIRTEDGIIPCRKERLIGRDGNPLRKWLYSFRDPYIAMEQEAHYLESHQGCFDEEDYRRKRGDFGIIVYQSDRDMSLEAAHRAYEGRWSIEILYKFQKSGMDEDTANKHKEMRIVGSEFINYLSSIFGSRMLKFFLSDDEYSKMTFREALDDLRGCRKVRVDGGGWELNRMTLKKARHLRDAGLIDDPHVIRILDEATDDPYGEKAARPKGKPGRKKGSKDTKPRHRRTKAEIEAAKASMS